MKQVDRNCLFSLIKTCLNGLDLTSDNVLDNLSDLGMDSVGFIQMIVAIEEEFECEIPDEKLLITEMDTVEKIIQVLEELYDETNN